MNNPKPIHPGNFECFMETYAECLKVACEKHPEMYYWYQGTPEEKAEKLRLCIEGDGLRLGGMRQAVERGTFNKDAYAIKWACRRLGIDHTYKAIREFIT